MINNHELRRRIEEVKKDLKVLEKQVLELDYQIAPEVTGKAGEVTDVTKECQHDWGIKSAVLSTDTKKFYTEYVCFKCQEITTVKPPQTLAATLGKDNLFKIITYYGFNSQRAEEEHKKSGVYSEYKQVDAVNQAIKDINDFFAPLLEAEYQRGKQTGFQEGMHREKSYFVAIGKQQAIAEMKEKFEGRVNWLSDEYGSRKDFIINLRRNLFHPEEK